MTVCSIGDDPTKEELVGIEGIKLLPINIKVPHCSPLKVMTEILKNFKAVEDEQVTSYFGETLKHYLIFTHLQENVLMRLKYLNTLAVHDDTELHKYVLMSRLSQTRRL